MEQHIRLTLLFQEGALCFIGLFSQRHSKMLQSLSELEESAVQLDKLKKGASISSVAGSSVGMAAGVLSIVGLALAPVTAGVSPALTLTKVSLGLTINLNTIVTEVTKFGVNMYHVNNANNIFQSFMKDVKKLLNCLEQVASCAWPEIEPEQAASCIVPKTGPNIVDAVLKPLKVLGAAATIEMLIQEANAAQKIPSLAADLPDIEGARGVPKTPTPGSIALNALFIGMGVISICKDSISLAKGTKNEVSQLIRSRAGLWHSELDSWEKIHDSLCRGIWRFRKSQRILQQPFYPELKLKREKGGCTLE